MTIEDIKNQVGQEAKSIIESGLNLESKRDKYKCPNSQAHNNGDKNPSMAWHKEALQFHCFGCGETIDIYTYHTKYEGLSHKEVKEKYEGPREEIFNLVDDFNLDTGDKKKTAKNNRFQLLDLTSDQLKYLKEDRGLSEETIKHFRLGNLKGNIGIPYIENDEIKGIKIKNLGSTGPKYFSSTGSAFGLFHSSELVFDEPLIITEGEIDSMSIYESGFRNVVSVGSGGASLDKLLKDKKEFLNRFKALIILGDNDEVGQEMKKRFMEEFEYKVKLPNPDRFLGCKDSNEVLLKHGSDQIKKIIENAELKIEGLRDLDITPYEGIGKIEGKYIPTGIPTIDYAINDLGPGQVTLITGRSNGGKSTFVNQILINAIDKGNRVLLIAGEGIQTILINNIYKGIIGKEPGFYDRVRVNRRDFIEPKPFVLEALQKWHRNKLTVFSKGESKLKTTDELFNLINLEIKMKHPNLIVVDNLMSTLTIEKVAEKWEKQSDFIQRCCDIAKAESVHIIIVLHPNKNVKKHSDMDFEDISGGSDIYNKADVIISVKRNYDEEKENTGEIHVLKNRYFPDIPKVETTFQKNTGLLLEQTEDGLILNYDFSWQKYLDTEKMEVQIYKQYQDKDDQEIVMFPIEIDDLGDIPF